MEIGSEPPQVVEAVRFNLCVHRGVELESSSMMSACENQKLDQ